MTDAITPFSPSSLEQAERLSAQLAKSALLPVDLRGKPADVLVVILTGHELGLSPMQAVRGLHIIKGRAILSADLMVALVKKHAECKYFRLAESTDQRATYETERGNEGKTSMSFTIEQAKQAGLLGNDNWRKYPSAMLRARCASALTKAVYPDLVLGVYDSDEAREIEGSAGGEIIRPEPPESKPANDDIVDAEFEPAKAEPPWIPPPRNAGVEDLKARVAAAAKPRPWDAIKAHGVAAGLDLDRIKGIVKGVTGKTKPSELTPDDLLKVVQEIDSVVAAKTRIDGLGATNDGAVSTGG